eukprot:GEMP01032909.1.p1 GENE.GEMP01032909.1~~GEMP01032909.1.p1  ORF type:complete len:416 (+),score=82.39 GEMP01032909.1:137-1384(+)
MAMSYSDAKSQLESDKEDVTNLLHKFIGKILSTKCSNAFVECESILRGLRFPREPHGDLPDDILEVKSKDSEALLALMQQPVDDEGTVKPLCAVPNFLEEAAMFESAGYGFGPFNYSILCALRRLAANTEGLKKIRLWGKVLGSGKDYWIAEGVLVAPGEATEDPLFEPQGTGANFYSYWVTTDLNDVEWNKLPDVEPQHIIISRDCQKVLSGTLDAPVSCYPFFPGTERNYLRAIIARITADTVLSITGYLVKNEEGEGLQESENFVFPKAPSLKEPTTWCHGVSYILRNGRTSYPDEEPVEGENEEAKNKERDAVVALDPPQDVLRAINAEHWALKVSECQTTAHAHSLKWPGAVVCLRGTAFTNIYVGYGRQLTAKEYSPCAPTAVQQEAPDGPEQPEPQPPEGPPAPAEQG